MVTGPTLSIVRADGGARHSEVAQASVLLPVEGTVDAAGPVLVLSSGLAWAMMAAVYSVRTSKMDVLLERSHVVEVALQCVVSFLLADGLAVHVVALLARERVQCVRPVTPVHQVRGRALLHDVLLGVRLLLHLLRQILRLRPEVA